jgi:sn-glycerol 3-phosphate transport system substrate-binding protein
VKITRFACVLAALALLAACGGSGVGSTDTTATTPGPATTAGPGGTTASTSGGTTTAGPTTTAQPVGDCPVDALASAGGTVDITMWHALNSTNEQALQALVDGYNASQQKVKVSLVNQSGYDDNFDKFRTASVSDRPDIVQLPEYYLQVMADSKSAVPVQACVNAESYDLSDYVARNIAYFTIQGALQAMPFNTSNPVLFFNRAMFVKAGLDPLKPPTTLAELAAAAKKIKDSGAATYGLALETGTDSGGGWFLEQWSGMAGSLYADNGNGRTSRATKVLFDNDLAVANYTLLQQMVKDGTAVNVGENPQGQAQLFKMADATQPAAMALYSSAGLGPVLNLLKGGGVSGLTADDLGIGEFPGPTGEGGNVVGGAALYIVKGKSDEKTAAAWDFIKYATGSSVQATWAAATGYIPVRTSSADVPVLKDLYTADPRYAVALHQLEAGTTNLASAGPVVGPLRQVRQATAKALQQTLDGADPKQALDQAAADSNKQIADYNKRVGA